MKPLLSIFFTSSILLVTHSISAQTPNDYYDFFYPKIKFIPAQPAPAGTTFKLTNVLKTERLSEKNLANLLPLIDIDLKYSRKSPDVTFFFNVSGITITGEETISESGKYFRKISYTIKNSINCIDKNGATFNSLAMEDGTKIKSINVGSNFFRQLTSQNDKYPKPAEIPNIDGSLGYVPSFEESFGKIPPTGFSTTAELDAFVKKYNNFISAKAEALAVETEFSNNIGMLEVLYGSHTFREDFSVATVKKPKSLSFNYDDFDKAAEQLKNAYKIFSVNVTDTASYYPMLRSVVSTYTAIEAANEERIKFDIVQSVLQHNLSLANAWLLNIDEAMLYARKLSANRRAAPGPIPSLQHTIAYLQKRAVVKNGYSGNLLEKMPK